MLNPVEARDHGRVAALLAPSFPNGAFVHAVLEGKIPGQVFAAWDGRHPRCALITTGSPFCFIVGAMPPQLFEEALGRLKERPPITLVGPVGPEAEAMAARHGFVVTERVQLGLARLADAEGLEIAVPAPYRLARVDADLFPRVLWKEMVYGIFGSAENYLEHHYGFCVLHDDQPVAESHGVVGGGLVELGAFTSAEHRGQGLAAVCVRQVARHGVGLGLRATSSNAAGKVASERLAEGTGMRREFAYRVLTL